MSDSERPTPDPGRIRIQDTVRLSAEGLAKVLGDLEARIMRTMWELGRPVPARTVYERISLAHAVAIHTVITVLNKLVEKGLLRREKKDDLLHYEACVGEEEFRSQASRRVVEGILSFGPEAVTASFVDVLAESDPERLAELGELIRRRLGGREEER
ncbi:MAG TPA: BlaI/MecI/CopY family transcriptional regulator [Longimicrobium sp.]|nr:BlaI/MecI/CopY family transcriptional regulator [Longimicrobium sp.]